MIIASNPTSFFTPLMVLLLWYLGRNSRYIISMTIFICTFHCRCIVILELLLFQSLLLSLSGKLFYLSNILVYLEQKADWIYISRVKCVWRLEKHLFPDRTEKKVKLYLKMLENYYVLWTSCPCLHEYQNRHLCYVLFFCINTFFCNTFFISHQRLNLISPSTQLVSMLLK